jgi:hypothetical protein
MKISSAFLLVAFSAGTCVAQAHPSTQCPTVTGAYYLLEGNWKPMEIAHSTGMKVNGLYTHTIKAAFKDSQAPYQTSKAEAQFCLVNLMDSGRDITLAKFTPVKNGRELQIGKAGLTGVKIEVDQKNSVPLTVEKQADRVYLVVTSASNQATNIAGFDIGFHPAK